MLNPALFKLMRLQGRGFLRRSLRGVASPKRMLTLIIGLVMLVLWLGPVALASIRGQRTDPIRVQATMPLALLGICLLTIVTSAGDKAIAFTPGEIDFLFPAPFTRRQLISYKLAKSGSAALLTGLFFSVVLWHHARWWPACYLGIVLSLLFVQLFSINAVIIAQTLGAGIFSNIQRIALGAALLLVVIIVRQFVHHGAGDGNLMQMLYQVRDTPIVATVLAPFDVFGHTMTAGSAAGLVQWGALAVAINCLLLILVFSLDHAYAEAAMGASTRRYAQIQRIRGGGILSIGVGKSGTFRLPQAPWLLGAGPIAWRQAVSATRSARGLLLLLLIIAIGAGPALASVAYSGSASRIAPTLIGMLLWLTILVATMLKFDFRGDVDHMEMLKALPIRPAALVSGQLLVPSLMLAVIHVIILLGLTRAMPSYRTAFRIAAILAFPVDLLLFAVENLIFLLFPARPAAVSPGDFQVLGRQVIVMAIKLIATVVLCLPSLTIGVFVWILSNKSPLWLTLVMPPLLLLEAAALVPILAWAFNRFDPSLDTPA